MFKLWMISLVLFFSYSIASYADTPASDTATSNETAQTEEISHPHESMQIQNIDVYHKVITLSNGAVVQVTNPQYIDKVKKYVAVGDHVEFRTSESALSFSDTHLYMRVLNLPSIKGDIQVEPKSLPEEDDLTISNIDGNSIHLSDGSVLSLSSYAYYYWGFPTDIKPGLKVALVPAESKIFPAVILFYPNRKGTVEFEAFYIK